MSDEISAWCILFYNALVDFLARIESRFVACSCVCLLFSSHLFVQKLETTCDLDFVEDMHPYSELYT